MSLHRLVTHDGAAVDGVLRRLPGSRTVVSLMHPRSDQTHHGVISTLLEAGFSVWTQTSRSPNSDVNLLHELALVDYARGQEFLRVDAGFETVASLGHSSGGALAASYHQQAGLPRPERIAYLPSGRHVPLATTVMPAVDLAIFLAAHPGQGQVLQRYIDPSVAEEADRLSTVPDLDMYSERNGFRPPPEPTRYSAEFLARYRIAQQARVARIDAAAWRMIETSSGATLIITYRTDADPAMVDLSIDPNGRVYGSLFGARPDLSNYGLPGFARILTAEAWLSSWSANVSRAKFSECARGVQAPTLFLEFDADTGCLPHEADQLVMALASTDVTRGHIEGNHYGLDASGQPTGLVMAAEAAAVWLDNQLGGTR
ncbi:alpha/beta hydrolase [Amycolatopsis pithecellobii]|uniref:Alpha/beta hydrolase n=1 Tax=Amycolatopsis pithecellobii TaxID=664692 RepID=A0A6N7Z8Q3_9PSEU|nr:alpha/beta hydrolase [Amycolatopsis pithecellobii]MTD58010.1 alpha/beta hydrolase [Amycolatopsis pithecellobii]